MTRMYFEAAGIAESTQDIGVLYYISDFPSVIVLVQEITRFLPIGDVYDKLQAVFPDSNLGIKGRRQKPFLHGTPLEFPYRDVISLINAFWAENFLEGLNNG